MMKNKMFEDGNLKKIRWLTLNFVSALFLSVICMAFYMYKSILVFNFIFFIPFLYFEKNKKTLYILKLIYSLMVLYLVTYMYEIIYLNSLGVENVLQISFTANRIIMAWSYFITLAYITFVSIKHNKISLPEYLLGYKSILLLISIGLIYTYIMFEGLNVEFVRYNKISKLSEKLMYYKDFFVLCFAVSGIVSLFLFNVLPIKNFIKLIVTFVSSVYILNFLAAFILVCLAFSGFGVIANIFPLNIFTVIFGVLSMRFAIMFALSYALWGGIILCFNNLNDKYSGYVKIFIITSLFLSPFLLALVELKYPFNRINFN